ncbi:hypothetical protein CXG81DRAFT_21362 [Caulochytrium protostelioides]|nr:hypothetical protein CXG81DRAFT_21362 [Caulochytrium protostelioides]|eukprot:RKO98395.1 hypothetical protein CXG81DRAFT_21362 [Caulochytrium protostelioides]
MASRGSTTPARWLLSLVWDFPSSRPKSVFLLVIGLSIFWVFTRTSDVDLPSLQLSSVTPVVDAGDRSVTDADAAALSQAAPPPSSTAEANPEDVWYTSPDPSKRRFDPVPGKIIDATKNRIQQAQNAPLGMLGDVVADWKYTPGLPAVNNVTGLRYPTAPALPKGQFYFVIATQVRDMAPYLAEWVEFHLLQGVERILMYNNGDPNEMMREAMDPYIQEGLVEWVNWPEDAEKLAEAPWGPRHYPYGAKQKQAFDFTLSTWCRETHASQHRHAGCQEAAFLDAMARYRYSARWLGIWDVDEFMYVPLGDKTLRPRTVNDLPKMHNVLRRYEEYDEIPIPGYVFGTNGHFQNPVPASSGLPFGMMTERYKYHIGDYSKNDTHIMGFDWTRKTVGNPLTASHSALHEYTFEFLERQPKITWVQNNDIVLNHYQHRSILGVHVKAIANTFPEFEYHPTRDAFLSSTPDTSVQFLVPFVWDALLHRTRQGAWPRFVPPLPSYFWYDGRIKTQALVSNYPNPAPLTLSPLAAPADAPPKVCLAINHVDPNASSLPRLRKAIALISRHLYQNEPWLPYEVALVGTSDFGPARESWPEVYQQELALDHIKFVPVGTTAAEGYDILMHDLCTAPYVLMLEADWEARINFPGLLPLPAHDDKPVVEQGNPHVPLVSQAIRLMEAEETIGEVWLGDTPNFAEYSNRSAWTPVPFDLQAVTRVVDPEAPLLPKPSAPEDPSVQLPAPTSLFYRTQSRSDATPLGVMRPGGALKHRQRHITHGGRMHDLARVASHASLSPARIQQQQQLRVANQLADAGLSSAHFCLSAVGPGTPNDIVVATKAYNDAVAARDDTRLGHHRFIVKGAETNREEDLRVAAEQALAKALTRLQALRDCILNPDNVSDETTTGLMWRQRLVHHNDDQTNFGQPVDRVW